MSASRPWSDSHNIRNQDQDGKMTGTKLQPVTRACCGPTSQCLKDKKWMNELKHTMETCWLQQESYLCTWQSEHRSMGLRAFWECSCICKENPNHSNTHKLNGAAPSTSSTSTWSSGYRFKVAAEPDVGLPAFCCALPRFQVAQALRITRTVIANQRFLMVPQI